MKSSESNASASPRPSGVESTGLPATVTIACTWPSPGSRISSAITDAGSSPANSGTSRTRLRQRSWRPGPAMRRPTVSTAGSVNIEPPGESKWPESRLRQWIAHWHRVPKPWVETPIRP
ncbi:MAG: hypothetical protein JWN84_1418 [Nocardioides sp.]|nr:hypothetical protein [Nocardioides sp.]